MGIVLIILQLKQQNSISKHKDKFGHKDSSGIKGNILHKDKDDFWDEEPPIDYLEICKNQTSVLQQQTPFSETVVLENHTILQLVSKMTGEVIRVFHSFLLPLARMKRLCSIVLIPMWSVEDMVQLTKENQKYYITDLHSTNGTWVNDRQLMPGRCYELYQGETVKIADICYEVKIE